VFQILVRLLDDGMMPRPSAGYANGINCHRWMWVPPTEAARRGLLQLV